MQQVAASTITTSEVWNEVIKRVAKQGNVPASIEIAVLGNCNIGKTSLQLKYVDPTAKLKMEKIKTHGTDTKSVYVSIYGETVTKVKIWDTAGQETHANIVGSYVKRLDACLMVYDLTKRQSYESIQKWIKQLSNTCDIPVVIVGNKCDLVDQREVPEAALLEMGRRKNVHTFETSALTGHNVQNAFSCLIY